MGKRIYKHKCKECETDYYIEDLKLVSVARCPKCNGEGLHIGESEIKLGSRHHDDIDSLKYALSIRPKLTKDTCNHSYKTVDSKVEMIYADDGPYKTKVDAIFYCDKCLDIEHRQKVFEGDPSDDQQ